MSRLGLHHAYSILSFFHPSFCREHELQHPCLATLTTGGMMGDGRLSTGPSVGHRIYVPMETSFVHATRLQANSNNDDEKKELPSASPKYVTNLEDAIVNITSN